MGERSPSKNPYINTTTPLFYDLSVLVERPNSITIYK